MGYVVPNSKVQLFKGIRLDNKYMHTIYFSTPSEQDSWFSSKVFKSFNELQYRREGSTAVKVEADATELIGVSYMRFQNSRSGSKWYYAFVNMIDYVNENTAVIYYEIDVMQTWFIQNGRVEPCFVLREHTMLDDYFSNLEEEPIGSQEYVYDFIKDANGINHDNNAFTNYSAIITTTGAPTTNYRDGMFVGTTYIDRECNDSGGADNVESDLIALLGSWDADTRQQEVIDMYMFPTAFAQINSSSITPYTLNMISRGQFESYVPKNKKLYNYPFSYLYCTTHNGDANMYKWEYFPENPVHPQTNFKIAGTTLGGGQIMCYPEDYDGVTDNYEASVIMSDFPKLAYTYDAYQAWVAAGGKTRLEKAEAIVRARGITNMVASTSNALNTAVNSVNDIYGNLAGVSDTGRPINRRLGTRISDMSSDLNAMTQAAANQTNTLINIYEAKNKINYEWKDAAYRPNEVVGKSVPNIMVGSRNLNFYFYHAHVIDSELRRLDDFLSCYGYATNRVKVPYLKTRAYWNFIQTRECVISGNMPASSREAIERIFNGGITFWHNGDQVGNYLQSTSDGSINNPITVG